MLASMILGLSCSGAVFSAEQKDAEETREASEKSDMPQGILPIPGYGDDIADRSYLTGDWDGKRTALASDHGFQWDIDTVTWTDTALKGGTSGNPLP